MSLLAIILFFFVFAVIVTVFVLYTLRKRKKVDKKERDLYGGEDVIDSFLKHIE